MAYHEAHRFSRRTGIPYDDLIGAAHIGLAKGAHRYDQSRGYKPSTYLVSLIRGELLHYCRDRTYLIRISHKIREMWMKGRKLIPMGTSDLEIAQKLGVELDEWLECRHICSGPPVQLNDAVHDVSSPGYHGKPQLIEDDRTGLYMDAVRTAWESLPSTVSTLFWNVNGSVGTESQRVDALNRFFDCADAVLDGSELPPAETVPINAASCGGGPSVCELDFEDQELGNGRFQASLF